MGYELEDHIAHQKRLGVGTAVPIPSEFSLENKRCDRCRRTLPLSRFWRNVNATDGKQQMCKDCHAENQRTNHNIDPAPPRRRRSPYDRIRIALSELEIVAHTGSSFDMLNKINDIRKELKL